MLCSLLFCYIQAKREMGVFVTDINDNTPSFMNLPNYIHIKEDTPLGRIIYQVTALDLDTGMGGLITYSILVSINKVTNDRSAALISMY